MLINLPKENLNFIDSSIRSLSQIGFEGVYNVSRADDTRIDNLIIHFIDRYFISGIILSVKAYNFVNGTELDEIVDSIRCDIEFKDLKYS